MANEHIDNLEERMIVLHDKAAREGFSVPDEVIEYIAEKYALATTLKGALINVQAYASRKGVPVTLGVARLVLDGIREQPAPPAPVEEPTPVVASFEPDVVVPEEQWEPEVAPAQPAPTAVQPASGGSIVPAPEETEWGGTPKPALGLEPQPAAPAPQPVAAPQPATPTPADEPAFLGGAAPAAGPDPEITGTLFTPPPPVTPAQPAVPAAATPPAQPAPQPAAPQPATPPAPQPAPQLPPATVWFAPMRSAKKESLVKRAGELLKRAGLNDAIEDGDLVAVKLHFGEEGNTGFVHPVFLRETVRRIRKAGGKPFLTDANTLYRGKRANAVDHLTCATRNGFSFSTINAPVVIADGLTGADGVEVPISGFDHFDSVKIGAAAVHADAMVVVTHVKGHEATGFGGAMKNVGMGLGTRAAKQRMHSDLKPQVNAEKCTACKRCVKSCPVNAIEIHHKVAVIDYDLCYGCGECVAACPYGAIGIQWKTEPDAIQEKIVEHCAGAVAGKEGKVVYLSFITNVSPDCDCWSFSDAAIVRDIGVLASTDLVAIDQAAYDLVTQATGLAGGRGEGMAAGDDKFKIITGIDGTRAMEYAEKHGLGTRRYELKQLD